LREYSFDVLTPDQRLRIPGTPVGLKNMANGNLAFAYLSLLFEFLNSDLLPQPYFRKRNSKFQIPSATQLWSTSQQERS
jgi:hypothetical protein